GATLYGGTHVFKQSVLLATGVALTIAVGVPFLGGASSVASTPGYASGSSVDLSSVEPSAAGALAVGILRGTTAAASASTTSAASDAAASSAAAAKATVEVTRSNAQPVVRAVPVSGVSAHLAASSTKAIVRVTVKTASVTASKAKAPAPKAPAPKSKAVAAKPVAAAPKVTAPAPAKVCPKNVGGAPSTVPGTIVSGLGVRGTTNADLASFALRYNAIRVANCLPPIPLAHIRYDSCLQQRMFWIAEDPSTNPASAWGHGVPRSDRKPIVGCDGDIAGGMGDTGAAAAQKWWNSPDHRQSLYQPQWGKSSYANVCIGFAMSHGGVPNDPAAFSREAARWENC
ncbi:MAG: hypothetical protein QOE85_976, partial [Actinomycetota bacterium]|nr:hypothetical protein [Actinomycetota bacterium]